MSPKLVAVRRILNRETGQGLMEYALLAAVIAVSTATMLSPLDYRVTAPRRVPGSVIATKNSRRE